METRKLGNTDLHLSRVGFGCASAWGKTFYKEEDAIKLFFDAYDAGINYYDTGHSYGHAEVRLGKCLAMLGSEKRKDLVISTKCGTRVDDNGHYYKDWSVDWLKRSLETSLDRLNTDYIDMLNLHSPALPEISDEVWCLLEDFKKQKLVSAVGVSCLDDKGNELAVNNTALDFIMVSYNLFEQHKEDVIKSLYESGKGVIAGTPLAKTLFSNDVFKVKDIKDIWYLLRALANNRGYIKKGLKCRYINHAENMSGNQIALKYVLDNPYITSAVFGTTSREHLLENVGALDITIPDDILAKIKSMK